MWDNPFYVPGFVEVAGGVTAQAAGRTASFFTDNELTPFAAITYERHAPVMVIDAALYAGTGAVVSAAVPTAAQSAPFTASGG